MSVRPPFCLPRLSVAGPRPGGAGLRPSRPSAAAGKTRLGRLLRDCSRRMTRLHPSAEHMNMLIASLIRILALLIALGLHGVIAMTALG